MSKGYDTFAAATAAPAGGLIANDLYWVAGQTAAGDGLEGWFTWHPGATGTADPNLITHAAGRFRRATFAPATLAELIADAIKETPLEVTVDAPVVPDLVNAIRVAVGTSSGVLIAARPTRESLAISNPKSNTAKIAFNTGAAVLASNPNLEPGDSVSMVTTAAFSAIASAACSVDVVEVYRS